MAARKPPGDVVMACLVPDAATPGALALPDAGVVRIVEAVAAAQDEGVDAFVAAVSDLLVTAITLGEAPGVVHPAAATLLAVLGLLQPLIADLPGLEAQRLQRSLESAGARFKGFAGEQDRVTRVLDSGARPAGTTAASPMARFALLNKVPPRRTDG